MFDPATREVDFESAALTENTRASYPIGGWVCTPRSLSLVPACPCAVLSQLSDTQEGESVTQYVAQRARQSGGAKPQHASLPHPALPSKL